jgi:hypothetical protein
VQRGDGLGSFSASNDKHPLLISTDAARSLCDIQAHALGSSQLYRYIPHNSVLWMLTVAGPVGFFLLWSMFWVGIYLAARALRLARRPDDRVAALAAICAQLLFLIQAFGDMGTQNWSTTWLVAAALTVAGRLAVSTGAWPAPAAQPVFTLEPAWNFSR